jgi:hypothetical protein
VSVTEWKLAGQVANVDREDKEAWSDVDNIKVCDEDVASVSPLKNEFTDWLRATDFGFTLADIPQPASIDGIEVRITRYASHSDFITDDALYLRDSSSQAGDNKASASEWGATPAEVTYGASDDDWNSGLDEFDVRSSDFGVDFSVAKGNTDSERTAYVDCIQVRVYYTDLFPTQYSGLRIAKGGNMEELCLVADGDGAEAMGGIPKIRKGGATYDIFLVETGHMYASSVRIKTPSGIKAIREKT